MILKSWNGVSRMLGSRNMRSWGDLRFSITWMRWRRFYLRQGRGGVVEPEG